MHKCSPNCGLLQFSHATEPVPQLLPLPKRVVHQNAGNEPVGNGKREPIALEFVGPDPDRLPLGVPKRHPSLPLQWYPALMEFVTQFDGMLFSIGDPQASTYAACCRLLTPAAACRFWQDHRWGSRLLLPAAACRLNFWMDHRCLSTGLVEQKFQSLGGWWVQLIALCFECN